MEGQVYSYRLGLKLPKVTLHKIDQIVNVDVVTAMNLREAKLKWAMKTNNVDFRWNEHNQTYWDLEIACVETNDPQVKLKR